MCEDCDFEDALELVKQINDMAEELPEPAEDFASSIQEKAESIGAWIEENNHVTDRQMSALENMIMGAERWLSR